MGMGLEVLARARRASVPEEPDGQDAQLSLPAAMTVMRAVVKRFEWDSLSDDHPGGELVELVLHVGPINGPGKEMFAVHVCTQSALAKLLDATECSSGGTRAPGSST